MSDAEWKRPPSRAQAGAGSALQFRAAEPVLDLLEGMDRTLERFGGEPSIDTQFPQIAQEVIFQSQLAALHAALEACEGTLPGAQSAPACRQAEKAAQEVCRKTLVLGPRTGDTGAEARKPADRF